VLVCAPGGATTTTYHPKQQIQGMVDKKLAIIYYYTEANKQIVEQDVEKFYNGLDLSTFEKAGILVEKHYIPTAAALNDKLRSLLQDRHSEIYLHFSGHGQTAGIPYDDWIVQNDNFAIMLDNGEVNSKIVSCFFSSCKSAQLAKIVSERKIPIVIGTQNDENIENKFAIDFQRSFYKYLAQKLSFKLAFEKACNDLDQKLENKAPSHSVQVRGLRKLHVEEADINQLQIILKEGEEGRHMIYPNLLDAVNFEGDDKNILFVYAENENVLNLFEAAFNDAGQHELAKLFLLKNEDLAQIDPMGLKQVFALREIKVLFIVQSEVRLFDNPQLKLLFDNIELFRDFTETLKFGIAVKDGVNESAAFENSDFFKNELPQIPKFEYAGFRDLFQNNEFNGYLSEITIDLSLRIEHVMGFPCNPTRDEILELDHPTTYVRVFFAPKKYEKLINYIVNWLYKYTENKNPIIVADSLYQDKPEPTEALTEAIKKVYTNKYERRRLAAIFPQIVEEGHIMVCRTELNDNQLIQLKENISVLLSQLDTSVSSWFAEPPEHPSFIFFINSDNFEFTEQPVLQISKTKRFSPPEPITQMIFESWTNEMKFRNKDFYNFLKDLSDNDFSEYQDQAPDRVIEWLCETLKIPTQQVLKIS
jgi:hypothetical protein